MAEIFNEERLNDCTGGDTDFGVELLEEFASLLCDELTKVANAVAATNFDEVRFASHAIKGASSSIGAEAVSEAAARLETNAKLGNLDATQAGLVELERQVSRFLNWYESPARAA